MASSVQNPESDEELAQLRSKLRSLVVSNPTPLDLNSLLRDYREYCGCIVPYSKYGYSKPLKFFQEKLQDSFSFHGDPLNPLVKTVSSERTKHLEELVAKQGRKSKSKCVKQYGAPVNKYVASQWSSVYQGPSTNNGTRNSTKGKTTPITNSYGSKDTQNDNTKYNDFPHNSRKAHPQNAGKDKSQNETKGYSQNASKDCSHNASRNYSQNASKDCSQNASRNYSNNTSNHHPLRSREATPQNKFRYETSNSVVERLKRLSLNVDDAGTVASSPTISSSTSSMSSGQRGLLDDLRVQLRQLMADHPNGVWCSELMHLYKEKFGGDLKYQNVGSSSVVSLARKLVDVFVVSRPERSGDWFLNDASQLPSAALTSAQPVVACNRNFSRTDVPDTEDVLPGIPYDAGVFPEDCMQLHDTIPAAGLDTVQVGDQLDVDISEVYSPSHFWIMQRGKDHASAVNQIMDDMNAYFASEGKDRYLSLGALHVGHYCSAPYDGDWHRSVIVEIVDHAVVKVRHVDYGTVIRVNTVTLRPIRREWAQLPAQAIRARLADVRPAHGLQRWPGKVNRALLTRVHCQPFVAEVAAVRLKEEVLEVYLVDTSGDEDVCLNLWLDAEGMAEHYIDADVPEQDTSVSVIDTSSELSASASDFLNEVPRKMRIWEAESDFTSSTTFNKCHSRLQAFQQHLRLQKGDIMFNDSGNRKAPLGGTNDINIGNDVALPLPSNRLRHILELTLKNNNKSYKDSIANSDVNIASEAASGAVETDSSSSPLRSKRLQHRLELTLKNNNKSYKDSIANSDVNIASEPASGAVETDSSSSPLRSKRLQHRLELTLKNNNKSYKDSIANSDVNIASEPASGAVETDSSSSPLRSKRLQHRLELTSEPTNKVIDTDGDSKVLSNKRLQWKLELYNMTKM